MSELFELKMDKPLRKYEAILIFHPDCLAKELKDFFKEQREVIRRFSGSFYNVDSWGKRRLTHPIRKLNLGLYFHTLFEAKAEAIYELERVMRINERVLRFMHVQLDPKVSFKRHIESYRDVIHLSKEREQEREMRRQKRFLGKVQKKSSDHPLPFSDIPLDVPAPVKTVVDKGSNANDLLDEEDKV